MRVSLILLFFLVCGEARAFDCGEVLLNTLQRDPELTLAAEFLSRSPSTLSDINSLSKTTFFVPVNAAFLALDEQDLSLLKRNSDFLNYILEFHITAGTVTLRAARSLDAALMLNGRLASLMVWDNHLWLDDAQVLSGDQFICNSLVHKIDHVLGF